MVPPFPIPVAVWDWWEPERWAYFDLSVLKEKRETENSRVTLTGLPPGTLDTGFLGDVVSQGIVLQDTRIRGMRSRDLI